MGESLPAGDASHRSVTTPSPGTAVSPSGAGGVSSAITPDRVGRPVASAVDGPKPAALMARIRKS